MSARRRMVVVLLAALSVVSLSAMFVQIAGAQSATPVPGSQGTDTSLPLTDSAVTVHGRGEFADLAITVNQTENLTNQAVSITWEGGTPTRSAGARFGSDFLQIMQCWGDDDGTVEGNPGPPPEQCVWGGIAGTYTGASSVVYSSTLAVSRIISRTIWENYDPAVGYTDPASINVWRPFRAVDGTVVNSHVDPAFNPSVSGGNYWLNPYFDVVTTNEVGASATGPDGTGAELFQVNTGVQSSGLGCGQRVQRNADGGRSVPRCWIVVVPRGAAVDENAGATEWDGVLTSPLNPTAWASRVAIPIEFNPVDSPCSLADTERRISGNELMLAAVSSWQPALCGGGDLPPYSYAPVGDLTARQQLLSSAQGAPGMVTVSRPVAANLVDPTDPVVYAPLAASGVVIGFNIERSPRFDAPASEQSLVGVRVAELDLTPRLVAKLLTQSYRQNVSVGNSTPPYTWDDVNPVHLGVDPDFLRFNPEFALLNQSPRPFSGLSMPAANSDAARQVWEWVLADPEAAAWLAGAPDEWGMRVNPVYATTAAANSTGLAFGQPTPNGFLKSDPYCYQAGSKSYGGATIIAPQLCGLDWIPYARSFADAAQVARTAYDGARTTENPYPLSSSTFWSRDTPQTPGSRTQLVVTDSPSAAQFGVQTARLSRAGDNSDDRTFVAPDIAGLLAGVAAMVPSEDPHVLESLPLAAAPDAYPLAALTYAAVTPLSLDTQARNEYSAFIDYAVGPGQVPGLGLGQLPRGYAALPAALTAQATAAAATIRDLQPPPASEPEPEVSTPTTVAPEATPSTEVSVPPGESPPSASPGSPSPSNTGRSSGGNRSTGGPPASVETTPSTAESVPVATGAIDEMVAVDGDESDVPEPTATSLATPFMALGRSRFAVPGLGFLALGSTLGALEISKRPRRAVGDAPLDDGDPT